MRLLHVADLHLGRNLGDLSREVEQRAVVGEMITMAREHDVALTVISGDVFDAFNPPAWAEDLFFELLDGLAEGGHRGVAVIAGNHDSGLRLSAASPLARRLGIMLAGEVGESLVGHEGSSGTVRVVPLAPQVARVELERLEAPIIVGLLPYLSESLVLRQADDDSLSSVYDDESRYGARLSAEIAARSAYRDPRAVNLLVMHQFLTGGTPSDSERRLRMGARSDLDVAAIPEGLSYVALGHLHRPQEIPGAPSPAVYAGSPIAYSFSEAHQQKRAVLVEVSPGKRAEMRDLPFTGGRPLEIWPVKSLAEAEGRAQLGGSPVPVVEVRADYGRPLSSTDLDTLFKLQGVTVLSVRDLYDPAGLLERAVDEPPEMAVEQLFRELWVRKHRTEPDDETMVELASAMLEVGQAERRGSLGRGRE